MKCEHEFVASNISMDMGTVGGGTKTDWEKIYWEKCKKCGKMRPSRFSVKKNIKNEKTA
ncbi:MAG: hypothetical protein PHW33_01335 [Candidatus Portnoybacteria bacterium]|jgi:hypothetical protein|nr:hypothetical protein [Candidatus Portnoybacteria bacterium]